MLVFVVSYFKERRKVVENQKERAAFICVKDTIDGAYPSLVLGINAARLFHNIIKVR